MHLRILFLDDYAETLRVRRELEEHGVVCEMVPNVECTSTSKRNLERGMPLAKRDHERICDLVKVLTRLEVVDLVVLGNNLGYGLLLAEVVSERMKEQTVIVWNDPPLEGLKPYQDLGFKLFASRLEVGRVIRELANNVL
ncbi:MAG: hypothetical protein P1P90_04360 [Patescibacteria group bacterium]|nr:hypothetical protein [Patescibacteria group bacterium]